MRGRAVSWSATTRRETQITPGNEDCCDSLANRGLCMNVLGTCSATLMVTLFCGACGSPAPGEDRPLGAFGEVTSIVVVVNPFINDGSATTVAPGSVRSGIGIQAADRPLSSTDRKGLAVIQEVPTGPVPLRFDSGSVTVNVVQPKELYDVVVSHRPGGALEIIPAVRYPIGGQIKIVPPGGSIAAAAAEDNSVVFLQPGTYPGNFELSARNVLVFGAWSPARGTLSTIEGNVTVRGGGNRLRGVRITGTLSAPANNFSAAFCDMAKADISGNGVSLIRNVFVVDQATVPSSDAVLVDNINLPTL
jgi:hypothetical protein